MELETIREQFPILQKHVNNNPLVYLDNAATTHKPKRVINKIVDYYSESNSNIHRGVHSLSRLATEQFEKARKTLANHFNVLNEQQIIFTSGTTDSINIIALGLAKTHLKPGDEIILTTYEHHSNILPWQLWAQQNGGFLKVVPLKSDHSLDLDAFETLLSNKTKLIALAHVSNTLGLVSEYPKIKALATQYGIPVLLDGAQSSPHMPINLTELNPDFFACSAHKMYGPTGVGVLYVNNHWLNKLPISKTGGGTIKTVSFESTEYVEGALRFEPGTPNISGVIAFAEAIAFMNQIGMKAIFNHEHQLTQYAQEQLLQISEVEMYGVNANKAGVISFNIKNQHPFDVGTLLDKYGIAVRTGHHCTQPLMAHLKVPGTIRVSFACYNTLSEMEYFIEKLKKVIRMLN